MARGFEPLWAEPHGFLIVNIYSTVLFCLTVRDKISNLEFLDSSSTEADMQSRHVEEEEEEEEEKKEEEEDKEEYEEETRKRRRRRRGEENEEEGIFQVMFINLSCANGGGTKYHVFLLKNAYLACWPTG